MILAELGLVFYLSARVETLAPTTAMTHIAIQEALDGKVVEWMEKVSDEQYQAVQLAGNER